MPLPRLPDGKRDTALTIRVSGKTIAQLKSLSKKSNLKQAEVISFLIDEEFSRTDAIKRSNLGKTGTKKNHK